METIRFERDAGVGWLRLNRPEKLNAQTSLMWSELTRLLGDLPLGVRALVVIGEGRSFSSGIDLGELASGGALALGEPGAADPVVSGILAAQECFRLLRALPIPTVAAVRGHALGAGLQLALACDLRVVAQGARLGALELRYGIIPDLGATVWLPRVVGDSRARDLVLTARQVDATEAHRIGLADRLVEPDRLEAEALELARELAGQPPLAVAAVKQALDQAWRLDDADALRLAAELQAGCLKSADFGEAVRARMESRAPEYAGH
ncbi:MAG: enoyl-CoA hydratase/isomerase family protein [Candidatus Dormibacteria bacterium]